MIEFIKNYVLIICIVAVISGLLTLISPSGAYEKPFKLIVAVFMLICIISPFVKGDILKNIKQIKFDENSITIKKAESSLWKQTADTFEYAIKEKIKEIVYNKTGQKITDIKVDIDVKNNNFVVKGIRIAVPKAFTDKINEIKAEIKNALGVDCEVIIL